MLMGSTMASAYNCNLLGHKGEVSYTDFYRGSDGAFRTIFAPSAPIATTKQNAWFVVCLSSLPVSKTAKQLMCGTLSPLPSSSKINTVFLE